MITKITVSLTNEEKTLLLKAVEFFDEVAEQFGNIDDDMSCAAGETVSTISEIVDRFKYDYNVDFDSNERS